MCVKNSKSVKYLKQMASVIRKVDLKAWKILTKILYLVISWSLCSPGLVEINKTWPSKHQSDSQRSIPQRPSDCYQCKISFFHFVSFSFQLFSKHQLLTGLLQGCTWKFCCSQELIYLLQFMFILKLLKTWQSHFSWVPPRKPRTKSNKNNYMKVWKVYTGVWKCCLPWRRHHKEIHLLSLHTAA